MFLLTCLLAMTSLVFAQSQKITGTVVSADDGQAVIGAYVMIAGTSQGTVTDVDGQFSLNAAPGTNLQVSFMGMETVQVAASNGMKVTLQPSTKNLDEIVMVAYGTAKRQSLTGSVASVNTETLEKIVSTSVTGALEGAAPGVQVNNTYGEPGTDPTIRIRGFASINGSNAPLYVLDGVPYDGNISDLNSSDIESISVLKDASSAALYGNRAANGVVLISTKKAKMNVKPVVALMTNQGGYTRGIKEYERLAADPWMELQWTGLKNYAMTLPSLSMDAASAASYATAHLVSDVLQNNIYDAADDALFDANGKLTAKMLPGYDDLDWEEALERVGRRQEYTASYTASSELYNVYASVGYLNEEGYVINTNFERYSGRVNTTFTPTKWFKGGVNLGVSQQNQNYNSNANGTYFANPFYFTRYTSPIFPVYLHNADGTYIYDADGNKQFDTTSPYLGNRHIVFERLTDVENNSRLTLDATAFATITLPANIQLTVKGNKYLKTLHYSEYNNPEIGDGAANNGRFTDANYHYETINFQQQLYWEKDFEDHHIDVLAAHESYSYDMIYSRTMNTNMALGGIYTMGNFTSPSSQSGAADADASESYLGRIRYNMAEKYFFDASFRRDGSSRFHKDNRWGDFYSFGAAWDIAKEDFMADVDWTDYLKLRASYGEVGNNYNDLYAYQALYELDKNGGSGALYKQALSATELQWETTKTIDVALEGRFFNRLNASIGYFDKISDGLIFAVKLPASAGAYIWGDSGSYNLEQLANIGCVANRGLEIAADVDLVKTRNFKWNLGADATIMKNVIETLPDHEDIVNGSIRRLTEGRSIYEFYTYHFEGVDQLTGNSLYTIDPAKADAAAQAGNLVNINGKAYTDKTDFAIKGWNGSALPKAYGSIHTDFTYKGLSLNVLTTYSLGGLVYDSSYQTLMQTSSQSADAQHVDLLNSWTAAPDGMTETSANRIDPNGIPVLNDYLSPYNNATSDRWLTDASYLVLKNISLSYQLPAKIVRKLDLSSIQLNAGIENALTLTARQGLNPQYGFSGGDDNTYTTARIFSVGATVKF